MADIKTIALGRIEQLKKEMSYNSAQWRAGNLYVGIMNLMSMLYGSDSFVAISVRNVWEKHLIPSDLNVQPDGWDQHYRNILDHFSGILRSIENDLKSGLIGSLQAKYQAEVFGDILSAAKSALETDQKDVAAVLASAAFEDSIKKFVELVGLETDSPGLQKAVNLLKSRGHLSGSQKGLIDSFVKLRNSAMHADWSSVSPEDVRSLIGFTEQFLLTRFEQPDTKS